MASSNSFLRRKPRGTVTIELIVAGHKKQEVDFTAKEFKRVNELAELHCDGNIEAWLMRSLGGHIPSGESQTRWQRMSEVVSRAYCRLLRGSPRKLVNRLEPPNYF